MTTTTTESATQASTVVTGPQQRTTPLERARFPLVLKLFLLTSLLIAVVVAIAVGITLGRANVVARATVGSSISGASKLFREFERQRLGRLTLSAQLVGGDINFVAYIQRALGTGTASDPGTPSPAIDLASIIDQLTQRRDSFGSDLLILLDDQGRVIARTDQPSVTTAHGEDFYERTPLVKRIIDDASIETTLGIMLVGKTLYHAAVVPVAGGVNRVRVGYLINAYAIDDAFANRIAEATNAGVLFAASPKLVSGGLVGRSLNSPSVAWGEISSIEDVFKSGKATPPVTVKMERSAYVMTAEPLRSDATLAGSPTVGAVVFVRSLDRELAPFVQIERSLIAGGIGALLLALIFSWLIARRITRPIERLASVAQSVTSGNLDAQPPTDRTDEIGILGRSFAQMISALRDKAALEELYAEMSARSQERAAVGARAEIAPTAEEGTILVTELHGVPIAVGEEGPTSVIAAVTRAMRIQEAEVGRQEGMVREVVGQRVVSFFPGDRGVIHAIRASRAINEELAAEGGPAPMAVSAGIASGDFVRGSVTLERESGVALVGSAPLLASLFASHSPAGYAYVAFDAAQAAGGDVMAASTREEVRLKWIEHPLPVASLPLASMSTNVMRAIATSAADVATMRVGATVPGATAPAVAVSELTAGQTFAQRYRIEQILGRGGMGVVYRATDTQLDEMVAIKTLPGDVMQRSPEDLERFKREIRLARKITHRNVLRTFDYGEAEGVYFISMEYVRGYTLADCLSDMPGKRMSPRVALGTARQICRGLQAAHEQAIIHRDIKPQNVLIDNRGEVKLMDFGIARLAEASEGAMTRAGLIIGTPHYMSPEQVQGKQLDPRADVYSMGVLIYEMLVGRRPFEAPSLTGVLAAHLTETPRPPVELRPEIGRDINAIILRCLEKDPRGRYANAGELLQELDRVQMQQSVAA